MATYVHYIARKEDYVTHLEKFSPPKDRKGKELPYVLFGKVIYENFKETASKDNLKCKLSPDLFLLNCDGSHAHKEKIDYYKSKGFVILKYNLPVGWKGDRSEGTTNFDDDKDHIGELRDYVESVLANDSAQISELKDKLAQSEKEKSEIIKRFEKEKHKAEK